MASIGTGSSPEIGVRRVLLTLRPSLYLSEAEPYTPYDVTPDGQRFIMARRIVGRK